MHFYFIAINIFDPNFSLIDKSGIPKWKRALNTFKRIAEKYKEKYDRPPVIIYDNINRLARKNKDILFKLLDDAKDNADCGNYVVVFISSEGVAPEMVMRKYALLCTSSNFYSLRNI